VAVVGFGGAVWAHAVAVRNDPEYAFAWAASPTATTAEKDAVVIAEAPLPTAMAILVALPEHWELSPIPMPNNDAQLL
jgi:hypothetical protein